jgi:nucleotide-binding universal stress UspA family protein
MNNPLMQTIVVGLDGSRPSSAAARWAAGAVAPGGRVQAIHVIGFGEELLVDAATADSVAYRHELEAELNGPWLEPIRGTPVAIDARVDVVEGSVAHALLRAAHEVGADAIAVGHHSHRRFGPQLVGHVTSDLLRHSDLPIVVVPGDWDPIVNVTAPVVVGVGVAEASRAAIRWAIEHSPAASVGLSLVHALGPRTVFRADGLLDVLAFHLDPSVLPTWVEEDLTALADQVRTEAGSGVDVGISVSVEPGRIGPVLVEAGQGARLLVIGRGEPPFVGHRVLAPYLRHVLVNAPCPIAVVPVDQQP